MIRLGKPRRMGHAPGEMSQLFYQGKGVAAVIAPWNFPLAISVGMVSAAIVSGCPVVYKPAGLSSCIGNGLTEMWKAAGLPDGVFNYIPGRGSIMGDYLVDHPQVSVIALPVLWKSVCVFRTCGKLQPVSVSASGHCGMGGKNATIIDDDADLDEAVLGALYAASVFRDRSVQHAPASSCSIPSMTGLSSV